MSNHFVFNQYYIDLLKRLKSVSKKIKDGDQKENIDIGKTVYKSIKENYITLDKSSDEYVKYVNDTVTDDFWTSYLEIEDINNADDWFSREDILNTQIFEKISLKNIKILLNDEFFSSGLAPLDLTGKDFERFVANDVKAIQTLSREIGLLK